MIGASCCCCCFRPACGLSVVLLWHMLAGACSYPGRLLLMSSFFLRSSVALLT